MAPALSLGVLELLCPKCTRRQLFRGWDEKEAIGKAEAAGWSRVGKDWICRKCPKSAAVRTEKVAVTAQCRECGTTALFAGRTREEAVANAEAAHWRLSRFQKPICPDCVAAAKEESDAVHTPASSVPTV